MDPMVGGIGPHSYSSNSLRQRKVIERATSMVRTSVMEACKTATHNINVADLGCSLGSNTLFLIREVLLSITKSFEHKNRCLPDVHFFLNDLPCNDFNTLFRSLASFHAHLPHGEEAENENATMENIAPLYISGVPGSFYGRIFPRNSMHFVHSFSSLHWLSQVPPGLQKDGVSLNRRNIYLAKTSPSTVFESYKLQHRKDFANFLESRAQEIKIGGRMVLSMLGREESDPTNNLPSYELSALADALDDMVSEDLIKGEELEKFDLPFYSPSLDEIRSIVEEQGSFNYEKGYTYKNGWGPTVDINSCNGVSKHDNDVGGDASKSIRAVMEPIIGKHFNEIDMDEVFKRFAEKVIALPHDKRVFVDITFELKKIQS